MQNIPQMHAVFMQEKKMFAQYLGKAWLPKVGTRQIGQTALGLSDF